MRFPASRYKTSRSSCATTARIGEAAPRISYATGSGPATVFVKAADPEHTAVNARMGGVFNEPRLFASGAPMLPLDHPQVFFTLIDEPRLDFIMVMEDVLARGCDHVMQRVR